MGSGTISGTEADDKGCLLERTENGKVKIKLDDGEERSFLLDEDEVIFRGVCGEEGSFVGFGENRGKIEPAPNMTF